MRIALLPGGGSHFGGFGRPRGRGKGGGDGKPARSVDGRSSVVRRGESQNPLGTRSSLSRGPPQGSVPGTANNRSLLDILGLGINWMPNQHVVLKLDVQDESNDADTAVDTIRLTLGWAF